MIARVALLLLLLLATLGGTAAAQGHEEGEEPPTDLDQNRDGLPDILASATFEQRLGEQIPLDVTFRNEQGETVQLGDYFQDGKPVILTMNYFECPNLCPLLLDGVVRGLNGVAFKIGEEFHIVTVSINPNETPELAADVKKGYVSRYGRGGIAQNWAFLTGDEPQIDRLAEAAGVHFVYDEKAEQYAHPSGLLVLTPQ